jgi:hypothetical protein
MYVWMDVGMSMSPQNNVKYQHMYGESDKKLERRRLCSEMKTKI